MSRPIVLKSINEGTSKYPYFLKNELIDDNIYIVQSATNIPNALYILDVWNREKFNPGQIEQYINVQIPYTLYLYKGTSDIQIEKQEINGGNDDYKVLVYKKDDGVHIRALLKY